jgi:hypothetical protein
MKNKKRTFIDISVITCAILFVALSIYGNLSLGPKEFARELGAAVGASAGVLPNEYNTLAQSLLKKEAEVNQRAAALAEREAAVMRQGDEKSTKLVFVVLSVGGLLLVLILLNFYLDWRRKT